MMKPRLAAPVELKHMKRIMTFGILPLIMTGSLLLSGCASHRHTMVVTTEPVTTTTTRTIVTEEPPPPRTEVEGESPSTADVWVAGNWTYIDHRWIWAPGHWELRPRENAVWIPGHWDENPEGKGWVWTPGRWE
jgi:hypothetical protein